MTPTKRKLLTEQKLASLGIVLQTELPPIESEEDINIKTGQQIAKRILVLVYLSCVTFDPSLREEVMMFLIHQNLWDDVTEREKELFRKPELTEEEFTEVLWRLESIWTLLWAINEVDELVFPNEQVNVENIFAYLPEFFEDTKQFIDSATTRSPSEILDNMDFIFRLTWALREATNRSEDLQGVHPLVMRERYISLNWIAGITDDWQDSP